MRQKLFDLFDMIGAALALHFSGTWQRYAAAVFAVIAIGAMSWWVLLKPPARFPAGYVVVESGQSLTAIADELTAERVISRPFLFKAIVTLTGRARLLSAGTYLFKQPAGLLVVTWRVLHGETGIEPVRVTFPEGAASFDMARSLASTLPGFDAAAFLALAAPREGYLFPDTYDFLPGATPAAVAARLEETFDAKTADLGPDVAASKHSEHDIIIVASLVEREAATPQDRRIVAGIIWKRLAKPMRLQVDAPFGYVHRDDGYQPTAADVDTDSPYNTYTRDGLPPTPIANPGLDAIMAALHPADTPYLYYATGKDGVMHYAETFEQHKANILKYL